MSAAGAKVGQRLLNTGSDAYGTSFGPVNYAYWWWNLLYVFIGAFFWVFVSPTVEQCQTIEWWWVGLILARNVGFLWLWVGSLHHLLYVWHVVPEKLKFNPSYPKNRQHVRDFFLSTAGACMDSAMQVGFLHLWATKRLAYYPDFWAGPDWVQAFAGAWAVRWLRRPNLFCAVWWRTEHCATACCRALRTLSSLYSSDALSRTRTSTSCIGTCTAGAGRRNLSRGTLAHSTSAEADTRLVS